MSLQHQTCGAHPVVLWQWLVSQCMVEVGRSVFCSIPVKLEMRNYFLSYLDRCD